jgi:hypothetical protein
MFNTLKSKGGLKFLRVLPDGIHKTIVEKKIQKYIIRSIRQNLQAHLKTIQKILKHQINHSKQKKTQIRV